MGNHLEPSWAQDEHDYACKLWDDGYSCGQIAKMLPTVFPHPNGYKRSRSAVIGRINRSGRKRDEAVMRMAYKASGKINGKANRKNPAPADAPAPRLPLKREAAFERTPTTVTFLARKFGQCAWPVDLNNPEPLCCGAQRCGKGPYCAMHARLSVRKEAA